VLASRPPWTLVIHTSQGPAAITGRARGTRGSGSFPPPCRAGPIQRPPGVPRSGLCRGAGAGGGFAPMRGAIRQAGGASICPAVSGVAEVRHTTALRWRATRRSSWRFWWANSAGGAWGRGRGRGGMSGCRMLATAPVPPPPLVTHTHTSLDVPSGHTLPCLQGQLGCDGRSLSSKLLPSGTGLARARSCHGPARRGVPPTSWGGGLRGAGRRHLPGVGVG
jgi:hypothetical protein